MLERVSRDVSVAIDGALVPMPGASLRMERATGERDLYRQLAQIARTEAGIARAASRWGPLARGTPLLGLLAPVLGAFFGPIRDRLAEAAKRWAEPGGDDGPDHALFEALAASVANITEVLIDRLMAYLELTEDGLEVIIRELEVGARPASFGTVVRAMADAIVGHRQARYRADGELPRWVRELDALGDLSPQVDRLAEAVDALTAASTPSRAALAIARLQELLAPSRDVGPLMDDVSPADVLAPLIGLIEHIGTSEPPAIDPPVQPASDGPARRLVPALLACWQAGDMPGLTALIDLAVPKLADPDAWRSTLVLGVAIAPPAMRTGNVLGFLVHPERANDWRALSIECALWRDAIDRLRAAEQPDATNDVRADLRSALVALARGVGPPLSLPETGLTTLDPVETTTIRGRLLRWIIARLSLAGVEPRPRRGLMGTEGRALWSIHDALTETAPPRRCEWPEDCAELLPPGAYAHRRYCDLHRREAARRKMQRRRTAWGAGMEPKGSPPAAST